MLTDFLRGFLNFPRPLYHSRSVLTQATTNIAVAWLVQNRGTDKSLARPTSLCNLFDGKNISFDASQISYCLQLMTLRVYTGVLIIS